MKGFCYANQLTLFFLTEHFSYVAKAGLHSREEAQSRPKCESGVCFLIADLDYTVFSSIYFAVVIETWQSLPLDTKAEVPLPRLQPSSILNASSRNRLRAMIRVSASDNLDRSCAHHHNFRLRAGMLTFPCATLPGGSSNYSSYITMPGRAARLKHRDGIFYQHPTASDMTEELTERLP